MREIKFRAWSRVSKAFVYGSLGQWFFDSTWNPDGLDGKEEDTDLAILDLEPWQQFTGLKDKNGKEIYEFDYLETGGTNVWWVRWGSGKYILQNISTGDIIDCDENRTQRNEVVGNSFESPREHKAMASDI